MKNRMIHSLLLGTIATSTMLSQVAPAEAWGGRHYDDYRYELGDNRYERHGRWDHRRAPVIISSYHSYYAPQPVYYRPAPVYVPPVYAPPVQRTTRVVCSSRDNTIPLLLGGAGGGILGHNIGKGHGRTAATIAGTLIGASLVGGYTSGQDCSEQVFESAPVGVPVNFQAQQADYNYTITPTRDYRTDGRYCREYQAVATVGGHYQETYGTACRQPDGQWEVVN